MKLTSRKFMFFGLVAVCALPLLAILAFPAKMREIIPALWLVHIQSFRYGFSVDHGVRIPAADGTLLATSLYLPADRSRKLGTILIRLPYGRKQYTEGLTFGQYFARNGYAVLVQDIRGKGDSEGQFFPYQHATADGVATLDWIVGQGWSNGRVGTFGCSALGELQHLLSRARHPAHRAMVPIGAGGAVGSLLGRHTYFGIFEGGVFQLAGGFGWFWMNGTPNPLAPAAPRIDIPSVLKTLPTGNMMQVARPGANAYDYFVSKPFTDPWWSTLEYIHDADRFSTPSLVVNSWGDQTVGDTLMLAEWQRKTAGNNAKQHVVIAPGNHCKHDFTAETGLFGGLNLTGANVPYRDWYKRWFDYWLYDIGNALDELPNYYYFQLGENRWLSAESWPPEATRLQRWYLASGGKANSKAGDGTLAPQPGRSARADEFSYDPADPVPSRGGPICCTGIPDEPSGPFNQADVETRKDVLVYTSDVLANPLRIAGPLKAVISMESSAPDTDLVARLVDVRPDGLALNVQEGALRLRYRNGMEHPALLKPGETVQVAVDMRSIAYTFQPGHRLRLHITSSSFPRLERNLNTGGRNFDESSGRVAINRVFHSSEKQSWLELPVLPDSDAATGTNARGGN